MMPQAMSCHSPLPDPTDETLLAAGRRALGVEAAAVRALASRLDSAFAAGCRLCLACQGRIVVTGMGKSGHVGGKIAATLASTGSPSFFLHPAEASHGDIGMITRGDLLLAVSSSGETAEIVTLLPHIKRLGVPLIAMTGNRGSTVARAADVALDVSVAEEACPLNLAPTASTTATLAMGDALAVALLEARGFTAQDFARSHPGGSLGRRLLVHVGDVMRRGHDVPRTAPDAPLAEGLMEMSRKGLGMTVIVDAADRVLGVFTDGDLRRILDRQADVHTTRMKDVMTPHGKRIGPLELAAEAVHLMETHRITSLPVVGEDGRLVGALNVHDLMRSGVV
ncbi:MAG: KpsF/GutQ family sugar-phosphate isomerase [Gammaproteobacteria bacterium]|nr:KpsF/GutQ family sugar-phosphate isomerase [Gammaproteobacteria bacterium]